MSGGNKSSEMAAVLAANGQLNRSVCTSDPASKRCPRRDKCIDALGVALRCPYQASGGWRLGNNLPAPRCRSEGRGFHHDSGSLLPARGAANVECTDGLEHFHVGR